MTRTQSRIFAALALAALIAIGLAAPALAGDERAPRPGAAGLQVAVDPATHQLRQPTAAEVQALTAQGRAMSMAKSGDVQITAFADGTLSAVLSEDYLNVWLAAVGADGSVAQICVDGSDAATAQPAAAALEEK